jgi:plastocyanin
VQRRRRLIVAAALVVLLAGVAGGTWWVSRPADLGPVTVDTVVQRADFDYAIPAGTGTKLDAGVTIELLPAEIRARVGQTIRIVNRDDRTYLLGPFIVGPRETLTQRFASPGIFDGACAVHPSGQIRLVVTA